LYQLIVVIIAKLIIFSIRLKLKRDNYLMICSLEHSHDLICYTINMHYLSFVIWLLLTDELCSLGLLLLSQTKIVCWVLTQCYAVNCVWKV